MTTLPRLVRERNVTAKIRPVSRSGVTLAKRVAPASTLSLSLPGFAGLDWRPFARNLRLFRGADHARVHL